MTVTNEIEKDTKANFAVAEVVADSESQPPIVAEASASDSKAATYVTVERSVLELATAVDTAETDKRKTELCCGSCCDYVKACVIVDIIFIAFTGLGIIASVAGFSLLNSIDESDLDDDELIQDFTDVQDDLNTTYVILMARQGVCILFAALGIAGAAKYNKGLVLAAGVWYCIDFVLSIIFLDILGCVMRAFFAYPHFGLFVALKKGNISRETYDREKYCCCDGKPAR